MRGRGHTTRTKKNHEETPLHHTFLIGGGTVTEGVDCRAIYY